MHDPNILLMHNRCVVDAGAGDIKEVGLADDIENGMITVNTGDALFMTQGAIFFSTSPARYHAGR